MILQCIWKFVHASVHTRAHSLDRRKTIAEFATDQSNVPNQCPVKRWCDLATVIAGKVTNLLIGRPRNRGSIATGGNICVSSPKRQDRLWDPPSRLFIGYNGHFPGGNAAGA